MTAPPAAQMQLHQHERQATLFSSEGRERYDTQLTVARAVLDELRAWVQTYGVEKGGVLKKDTKRNEILVSLKKRVPEIARELGALEEEYAHLTDGAECATFEGNLMRLSQSISALAKKSTYKLFGGSVPQDWVETMLEATATIPSAVASHADAQEYIAEGLATKEAIEAKTRALYAEKLRTVREGGDVSIDELVSTALQSF